MLQSPQQESRRPTISIVDGTSRHDFIVHCRRTWAAPLQIEHGMWRVRAVLFVHCSKCALSRCVRTIVGVDLRVEEEHGDSDMGGIAFEKNEVGLC